MKKCGVVGGRGVGEASKGSVDRVWVTPPPSFTHTLGLGFCEAASVRSSICGRVRVKVGVQFVVYFSC